MKRDLIVHRDPKSPVSEVCDGSNTGAGDKAEAGQKDSGKG